MGSGHSLNEDMKSIEIKGDWNITKAKLKQKWAKLTDDDLKYAEGKCEELAGRIQRRTSKTREAVKKAVNELCSSSALLSQKPSNKN